MGSKKKKKDKKTIEEFVELISIKKESGPTRNGGGRWGPGQKKKNVWELKRTKRGTSTDEMII